MTAIDSATRRAVTVILCVTDYLTAALRRQKLTSLACTLLLLVLVPSLSPSAMHASGSGKPSL